MKRGSPGLFEDFMKFSHPSGNAGGYVQHTYERYLDPFIKEGTQAAPYVEEGYEHMLHPDAFLHAIASHYHQSPGFRHALHSALNAENASAAAGGMVGSFANKAEDAKIASDMSDKDYNDYLNRALGIYGTGLTGEANLNRLGFDASGDLASGLANYYMDQQNLAAEEKMAKEKSHSSMLGGLVGAVGGILSHL